MRIDIWAGLELCLWLEELSEGGEETDGQAAKQADNAPPVDRMFADLRTGGIGARVRGCEAVQGWALALYGRFFFFSFSRVV